ncbi:MAG: permease, partial [Oscillospiraceae bacterium]
MQNFMVVTKLAHHAEEIAHEAEHHAGHNHGAFGEFIEHLLSMTGLQEPYLDFFAHIIVDTLNIFFLLIVVMTVVFFLTSYIDMKKLHNKLNSLKSIGGFVLATLIGVLSPFCSCSIVPVLMGLISMGVPISVCLCYLTASSMLNLTALLSLFATTGPKFAITYMICSIIIIIISSIIFSFCKLDNSVSPYHAHHHDSFQKDQKFAVRLKSAFSCTFDVFKRSYLFVLVGVILSSFIMSFFSIDTLSSVVNDNAAISTAIVSVIGIPLHSDIFSIAPIIKLLQTLSPSVALTFTLSTMAISLPSVIILTRAIKLKTVLVYCGVITAITIVIGYIGLLFT